MIVYLMTCCICLNQYCDNTCCKGQQTDQRLNATDYKRINLEDRLYTACYLIFLSVPKLNNSVKMGRHIIHKTLTLTRLH